MNYIKNLYTKIFHPPGHIPLAVKELENARRALLTNLTHAEYYKHQVEFERCRIKRLENYLGILGQFGREK
jgi:hypothetical protein